MLPFATFFFDLDGTLVDHFAAIHRSHTHTMHQLGLAPPTMTQVRAAVGGGLENTIANLVGPTRVQQALAIYRPYFATTMLDDVVLLAGARELLESLRARGAKLAVLTNKHGQASRIICEHLGIVDLLDGVFGAGDTPWIKPQPEFARHALETLGAPDLPVLLVGDSPYDIAAAKNAAWTSWCVTTGTHNAAELEAAGADRVFPDLPAIQAALASPK